MFTTSTGKRPAMASTYAVFPTPVGPVNTSTSRLGPAARGALLWGGRGSFMRSSTPSAPDHAGE